MLCSYLFLNVLHGKSDVKWWIPLTKASNVESIFIPERHHEGISPNFHQNGPLGTNLMYDRNRILINFFPRDIGFKFYVITFLLRVSDGPLARLW